MAGAYNKWASLVIVWVLSVALTEAQQTQACTWVYYANTLIYGGTANPANNLAACQTACQNTPGCAGIDWAPGNPAGQQCFTQTTQSPKDTNAPGVSHYDYVCNGTSTATGSTGTGTTIPGTATTVSSMSSTGSTGSTSPPACYWNVTTGTYIVGGTNNPATSLAACQAVCVNASMPPGPGPNPGPGPGPGPNQGSCMGIDWVWSGPSGFQCLLHTTQMNKTAMNGVDHYDYICPAPATPLASKPCRVNVEFYYDTSSPGGVNIPQIPNIDNCSFACGRLDSCAGLEYSPTTGCWIHMDENDFDQMYYQAGVIQIRFNRCPADDVYTCNPAYYMGTLYDVCASICYPQWTTIDNAAGYNGQPANARIEDESDCLEYCLNTSNCIGVDFYDDPRSFPMCNYYTSGQQSWMMNITRLPFVTQYRLGNRCALNCTNYPQRNDNTVYQLIDSWNLTTVNTESDCLGACMLNEECDAAQWYKAPVSQCVLAGDFYDYSSTPNNGAVTYLFRENCPSLNLMTTPGPGGNNGSGNGSCQFVLYSNTLIYGGAANPANTLQACMNACSNNATCQGIDWSAGNPAGQMCFIQSTQAGKTSTTGVNHYDYVCNGSSSVTTGPFSVTTVPGSTTTTPSAACWTYFPNMLIYNGVQNTGATSLSACQAACLTQPFSSCSSIEWDKNYNTCFFHNTQQGKYMANNVDHYDRSTSC